MFNKNKKAQIGETLTWVVATIVIIVILGVSIFIVSIHLKDKKFVIDKKSDLIATKSLTAYLLIPHPETGKNIYTELRDGDNLNDFNGPWALKIFKEFYEKDYPGVVWLGFVLDRTLLPYVGNDYFGKPPTNLRPSGPGMAHHVSYISEKIQLNKDKELELVLMKE